MDEINGLIVSPVTDMLTVLLGESGDNLAHLLRFYAPKAERILDVTFGAGRLVRRLSTRVYGLDIDLTMHPTVYGDATNLPFLAKAFEVGICDPPYLYGSQARHMEPIGTKTWKPEQSTWKCPEQLVQFARAAAQELYRCVTGISIVKIMDSRYQRRLVRNHDVMIAAWEAAGWVLRDQIVYLRTVTGSFVNPRTAQSAHGYFLIFARGV